MTFIRFVFFLIMVISLAACKVDKKQIPYNVLFITSDDLDENSLGCLGSSVPDISPNIDRFAEEGIRFENAFVNTAICQPSRAILGTG
jgi:N-sulfoglucosamine sulfohydrolase